MNPTDVFLNFWRRCFDKLSVIVLIVWCMSFSSCFHAFIKFCFWCIVLCTHAQKMHKLLRSVCIVLCTCALAIKGCFNAAFNYWFTCFFMHSFNAAFDANLNVHNWYCIASLCSSIQYNNRRLVTYGDFQRVGLCVTLHLMQQWTNKIILKVTVGFVLKFYPNLGPYFNVNIKVNQPLNCSFCYTFKQNVTLCFKILCFQTKSEAAYTLYSNAVVVILLYIIKCQNTPHVRIKGLCKHVCTPHVRCVCYVVMVRSIMCAL